MCRFNPGLQGNKRERNIWAIVRGFCLYEKASGIIIIGMAEVESMKEQIIKAVNVVKPGVVNIDWSNGENLEVDLSATIKKSDGLSSLANISKFKKVQIEDDGTCLAWPGDIQIGADTLYCEALAQAGKAYPTSDFNSWMKRNSLTLSSAANILGMSRRMIAYYNIGARPIPKVVGLACRGYEAMGKNAPGKKVA